ncbi:MAG: rare lipoprotein A [Flavobacteriales bacterium]|jgi:rare lipoprotein A
MNCFRALILGFALIVMFSGCGTRSYKHSDPVGDGLRNIVPTKEKDRAPANPKDVSAVKDAVPRYESRTKAGNKSPYKVKGIVYHLMSNPHGYSERARASWYGEKFQGNHTSNGEIYDMYQMTAAHKTLPIPSYVRVTNTLNGKKVVVRVNDRGPFAEGRVIDLSYAAAKKLDYLREGTAPVLVEYIDMPAAGTVSTNSVSTSSVSTRSVSVQSSEGRELWVQVAVYSEHSAALALKKRLASVLTTEVFILVDKKDNGLKVFKVQLKAGSDAVIDILKAQLETLGLFGAYRVWR